MARDVAVAHQHRHIGGETLGADVTMLVGNGYVPGHADYAMSLLRENDAVRRLFEGRLVHA